MVQPYTTTVSSVIVYQCQQSGFAPSRPSSVCGEDGRWSPDPSQVVCMIITATTVTQTMTPTLPASTSPGGIVGEYRYHMPLYYVPYLSRSLKHICHCRKFCSCTQLDANLKHTIVLEYFVNEQPLQFGLF